MDKLRLLLLEDSEQEAKKLRAFLEANDYEIVRVKNVIDAEKEIRKKYFDVVILDIIINGKPDGIEFAKKINDYSINVPFLFLTSMQSKSLFDKAKLTNPAIYLLKPYNDLELLYSIELAIESCYQQSSSMSLADNTALMSPDFLFIKRKRSVKKVNVSSINYVEVKEKYCSLSCDDGVYLIKLSLSKLKEMLSNPNFKQVHRNYLVNIKSIKELFFEDNLIVLEDDSKIPFSERYKNAFIKNNTIFR